MTIYLFSFSDSFFSKWKAEFSAFLAEWERGDTRSSFIQRQKKDVKVWASIKLFILQRAPELHLLHVADDKK
jgi:hypothetical protein